MNSYFDVIPPFVKGGITLKIKSFLGSSENAVIMQIRAARIHYQLIAYIHFQNREADMRLPAAANAPDII